MSATSGEEEFGLARLVERSRQSASHDAAPSQPDTVVTLQVRVTRPIVHQLPTTRLAHFETAATTRSRRPARGRARSRRIPAVSFLVASILMGGAIAGVGAYHHFNRPARHVAIDQAVVVSRTAAHAVLLSSSAAAITYQIPVADYTLSVAVAHPCWIVVKAPPDSVTSQVAVTLLPSSSPMIIPVHGSAAVSFAAQVVTITISAGPKIFGVIHDPVLGPAYTFVPSSS